MPEPWLSFLRELDSAVETEVRLDCQWHGQLLFLVMEKTLKIGSRAV